MDGSYLLFFRGGIRNFKVEPVARNPTEAIGQTRANHEGHWEKLVDYSSGTVPFAPRISSNWCLFFLAKALALSQVVGTLRAYPIWCDWGCNCHNCSVFPATLTHFKPLRTTGVAKRSLKSSRFKGVLKQKLRIHRNLFHLLFGSLYSARTLVEWDASFW